MTDPPRPDFLELADYTGVLRRRGWIALALAALGALVATIYLAVAPASYEATADVYVTPNSANQNVVLGSKGTSTAVNMDNEAQIVESNTVAVLAARTLHTRLPPQALLGQVTVSVPANTAVLAITCAAPSPGGAAACAQAFARGYLAARHATAANKLAAELTQEEDKAASLESRSVTLHNQIGRLAAGSAAKAQAVLELKTVSAKLDTLRTNISAINASVNTNPGYVITSAVPPSAAASPKPLLYLPSGLLAGLLAGLVAAFAADRRDDRVHTVREVERLDGLPVLYSVDGRRLSPPGAIAPARSAAGRGYAELAQTVANGLGEKDRVLLVAGGSPGPAAGVVAANLAAALARVRADVILVCADPRDTMTPALLGVGEARGLAEVLGGTATVAEVTRQAADISRLEVITPGMEQAAAGGQVRHEVTGRLVDGLSRDARYVIVCGLAGRDGADTFGLAEFADAALVVLELERTRRAELAACLRRLDRVRTPVLGAALLPELAADRGSRRGLDRGGRLGLDRGHRAAAGAFPGSQDQRALPGSGGPGPGSGSGRLPRSYPARPPGAGRAPGDSRSPAAGHPPVAGRSPGGSHSHGPGRSPGADRSPDPGRPPGAGQSRGTGRSQGTGRRAPAAVADPGRVPPGPRPLSPSRSARQPRWEPVEPAPAPQAQPPWDTDDPSWDAPPPPADHQEPPWDAAGQVGTDLSRGATTDSPWITDDPAGWDSPPAPPGRPRTGTSWEAGDDPAGGPGTGEPPWATGEPGRPEPFSGSGPGPGPAKPARAGPSRGASRSEPSRGAGKPPARPEAGSGSDQAFRVQPPWDSDRLVARSGQSPPGPTGASGAGTGRPESSWGGTEPSWPEPSWPTGESSWPEPMWGGVDPSRSEPAGGTADPAKSEAPRSSGKPSRPASWSAGQASPAGSWGTDNPEEAASPPAWGPSETWPLPPAKRDPGPAQPRRADPPDRSAGTG
jgi:capsular polysaccharide biosynthesis protein